jgi:preprotein translocase subunit SecF
MKRFIGFITLCAAAALTVGVGFIPVVKGMNGSADFTTSKKYVFKISDKFTEDGENVGTSKNDEVLANKDAIDDVIDTFESRLSSINLSSYQIEKVGYDTINLTFRAEENLYDQIVKYLTFNWSFYASTYDETKTVGETFATVTDTSKSTFFTPGSAEIQYKDNYPYVVITLANNGDDFKTVYEEAKKTASDTDENASGKIKLDDPLRADGDESTEETTTAAKNRIYVMNNWLSGLVLKDFVENKGTNYIGEDDVKNYLLFDFDATKPESFYWNYDTTKPEDADNFKQIYFGGYDVNSDSTGAKYYGKQVTDQKTAYQIANIWTNIFNSSSYDYTITNINSAYVNTDSQSNTVLPLYEYLVYMDKVQLSTLLIAALIGAVMILLVYLLNFGVNGILGSLSAFGTPLCALAIFNSLGVEFNIGAIIAVATLVIMGLFQTMSFFNKIKKEIYNGKTYKKSYQDGSKKAFWFTLDTTIIGLILGFTAYLIPNGAISSFGVLLAIGSPFLLLINAVIVKAVSWFVYNSNYISNNPQLLALDKKLIPDLTKDEKPTYFEAFKQAPKKKTINIYSIGTAVLLLASVIGISVFGSMNGNIFNSTSSQQSSEVYIRQVLTTESDNEITNYATDISDNFNTYFSKSSDGKSPLSKNITLDYYYKTYQNNGTTQKELFYVFDLGTTLSENSEIYYNSGSATSANWTKVTLSTAFEQYFTAGIGVIPIIQVDDISIKEVYQNDVNSYVNYVFICLGIGLAIVCVYVSIRFGITKGLVGLFVSFGGILITLGVFCLIRGPFGAVTAIGALLLAVFVALVFEVYFLNKKEKFKENVTLFKTDLAKRDEAYVLSDNLSYNFVKTTSFISSFTIITLLFALSVDKYLLMLIIVGMIINVLVSRYVSIPLETGAEKGMKRIGLSFTRIKPNKKKQGSKAESEGPEEAIFTGIND